MPQDPPSRDHILAARTPAELFGHDIDDLERRRTYARLIRAFRPEDDPDVFQHIRTLYEATRDEPPPADPASTPGTPAHVRLQQAIAAMDWPKLIEVALTDQDALLGAHDHVLVHALDVLICLVGPSLSTSVLDEIELLLSRPDLSVAPQQLHRMVGQLVDLRGLGAMAQDARIPAPVVEAVRFAWCRRPDGLAEYLVEAMPRLAHADGALDTMVDLLERYHPAGLSQLLEAELEVTDSPRWYEAHGSADEAHRGLPEEVARLWRARLLNNAEVRRALEPVPSPRALRFFGYGAGLLLLTELAVVRFPPLLHTLLSTAVTIYVLIEAYFWVREQRRQTLVRTTTWPAPAALVALAREHTLWPHELVSQLAADEPVPVDRPEEHLTRYAYQEDHPLLRFESDRTTWLRVLTPQHVERVRARFVADG